MSRSENDPGRGKPGRPGEGPASVPAAAYETRGAHRASGKDRANFVLRARRRAARAVLRTPRSLSASVTCSRQQVGPGQVEDPRPGSVASPPPGGCHPGLLDKKKATREARNCKHCSSSSPKWSPKATRPWSSRNSPAYWPSSAASLIDATSFTSTSTAKPSSDKPRSSGFKPILPAACSSSVSRRADKGLNLTAADYVFILDPWWNPAVEAQAVDRAHRIGQDRHVFAYRLIARDTVEEKMHPCKLTSAIWPKPSSRPRTPCCEI